MRTTACLRTILLALAALRRSQQRRCAAATINVLKAVEFVASFPLLVLCGMVMERFDRGLRISAATFGCGYGIALVAFAVAGEHDRLHTSALTGQRFHTE